MGSKAVNFKLDEKRILDIRQVASVFHITMTDVVNEALDEYLSAVKRDPFYRLTAKVDDASKKETEEVLSALDDLSDDDLEVTTVKHFSV